MAIGTTIIHQDEGGYRIQVTMGDPDQTLGPTDYLDCSFLVEAHPKGSPTLAELQKAALLRALDAIRDQIHEIDRS